MIQSRMLCMSKFFQIFSNGREFAFQRSHVANLVVSMAPFHQLSLSSWNWYQWQIPSSASNPSVPKSMCGGLHNVIITHMAFVVNVFNESSSPCIDWYRFVPNQPNECSFLHDAGCIQNIAPFQFTIGCKNATSFSDDWPRCWVLELKKISPKSIWVGKRVLKPTPINAS